MKTDTHGRLGGSAWPRGFRTGDRRERPGNSALRSIASFLRDLRVSAPRLRVPLLALCGLCVLPGCNVLPTGLADRPVGAYDRPYPHEIDQREVIDVQVIRGPETQITMTNTTARTFGPSTVWINGRFGRPIEGFRPGQTLRLDLYDFRDEYGGEFRGGGFFATKIPDRVMQVQIETLVDDESTLIGLVVVADIE